MLLFTAVAFSYLGRKINSENHNVPKTFLELAYQLSVVPRYIHYAFDNSSHIIISNELDVKNGTIIDINNPKNNYFIDSGYLLLGSYCIENDQSVVMLLDLKTSRIVKKWVPKTSDLKRIVKGQYAHIDNNATYGNKNIFAINHPFLDKQGNIYFHSTGPLIKMNSNGICKVIDTNSFHHSIQPSSDGEKWTCIFANTKNKYKLKYDNFIYNDEIVGFNAVDSIIFRKNVYDILEENSLDVLLLGTESLNEDPIHLNFVVKAESKSNYWEKGDLLISLRNKSMLMLYRPSTQKVIWYKIGPWISQHSAIFINEEEVECLSNNYVRGIGEMNSNTIIRYNFRLDSAYTVLKVDKDKSTKTGGIIHRLESKNFILDETNNGAISVYTDNKLKYRLVNKVKSGGYGLVFWSRYYTKEELKNF